MNTHLAKTVPLTLPQPARITLSRSRKCFTANAGETILNAALRHEIWLPHACRGGTCGTCRATVVAGTVVYEAAVPAWMQHDASQALLCCANPQGDITLDVAELAANRSARCSAVRPA